jgi:hypothetical protein
LYPGKCSKNKQQTSGPHPVRAILDLMWSLQACVGNVCVVSKARGRSVTGLNRLIAWMGDLTRGLAPDSLDFAVLPGDNADDGTPKQFARHSNGGDADGVGAWPERGIFDTQLGLNRNGRQW